MSQKSDKGFKHSYWNLSYRRKFIRTLWITPFLFLFFLLPPEFQLLGLDRNQAIALLFVLLVVQALYNYKKWKSLEQPSGSDNDSEP